MRSKDIIADGQTQYAYSRHGMAPEPCVVLAKNVERDVSKRFEGRQNLQITSHTKNDGIRIRLTEQTGSGAEKTVLASHIVSTWDEVLAERERAAAQKQARAARLKQREVLVDVFAGLLEDIGIEVENRGPDTTVLRCDNEQLAQMIERLQR